jgi:hypothetical protein
MKMTTDFQKAAVEALKRSVTLKRFNVLTAAVMPLNPVCRSVRF